MDSLQYLTCGANSQPWLPCHGFRVVHVVLLIKRAVVRHNLLIYDTSSYLSVYNPDNDQKRFTTPLKVHQKCVILMSCLSDVGVGVGGVSDIHAFCYRVIPSSTREDS